MVSFRTSGRRPPHQPFFRLNWKTAGIFLSISGLGAVLAGVSYAEMSKRPQQDKTPSREQVLWTETDLGYSLESDLSILGKGQTDFGQGRVGDTDGIYSSLRHLATFRKMMAFLLHTGVEWQRIGFGSDSLFLPHSLNSIDLFLGTDFRWSGKDQIRLQIQPGFYSDLENPTLKDINFPAAIAYTRIPSKKFQWTIGLGINPWRAAKVLPGGGFRWYIHERWKLKFLLPEPIVEYKANDVLHLSVGADFRGETYRLSNRFGSDRGAPELNRALLDYQEIRVGPGFSWNIKPLMEFNGQAGYMLDRSFSFNNNDLRGSSDPVPFVRLNLRILFQIVRDTRPISSQVRAMQYEFPGLSRFFKVR